MKEGIKGDFFSALGWATQRMCRSLFFGWGGGQSKDGREGKAQKKPMGALSKPKIE